MGGSVVENVNFQIKEQNKKGYLYYHKKLGKELKSFFLQMNTYWQEGVCCVSLLYTIVNEITKPIC